MYCISSTENEKWINNDNISKEKGSQLLLGDAVGKPIFGWGCCISEICAKAIFVLDKD